jgi:bifunctional non-homologous end joining protein LigD
MAASASDDWLSIYVVQKHRATRLHYDFRLEMDGVLKSWAIPKGPSLDHRQRRLAMLVDDHALAHAEVEGEDCIIWDRGRWRPQGDLSPQEQLERGLLEFELAGEKLTGGWGLVRFTDDPKNWLLVKQKDERSRPGSEVTTEQPESVVTGTTLD